jgi:hypothetical protein
VYNYLQILNFWRIFEILNNPKQLNLKMPDDGLRIVKCGLIGGFLCSIFLENPFSKILQLLGASTLISVFGVGSIW